MKRFITGLHDYSHRPEIDEFLKEIDEICKKHKMSISHEDGHGAFEVVWYNENCTEWLMNAHDGRSYKNKQCAKCDNPGTCTDENGNWFCEVCVLLDQEENPQNWD